MRVRAGQHAAGRRAQTGLKDLPCELVDLIVGVCGVADRARLACVCSMLRARVADVEHKYPHLSLASGGHAVDLMADAFWRLDPLAWDARLAAAARMRCHYPRTGIFVYRSRRGLHLTFMHEAPSVEWKKFTGQVSVTVDQMPVVSFTCTAQSSPGAPIVANIGRGNAGMSWIVSFDEVCRVKHEIHLMHTMFPDSKIYLSVGKVCEAPVPLRVNTAVHSPQARRRLMKAIMLTGQVTPRPTIMSALSSMCRSTPV